MKPKKPHPDFPLTPHVRGGWQKKYKGKPVYITAHDPDAALEEWFARKRAIDAGLAMPKPVRPSKGITVGVIANRYASQRRQDHDAGRLSRSELHLYETTLIGMVKALGRDTLVSDLKPDDFTRLYRKWEKKGLGAHAVANRVKVVTACWRFAENHDWIDRRPRYGSVFKKPQGGRRQGKPIDVFDVLRVAACAENLQLEAMVLLMMNAGYLASDCAALPRSALDLDKGIVRFPRPKMERRRGIDRVATLWPETVEALREVLDKFPDDPEGLVFRTRHGNRWVRDQTSEKGEYTRMDAVAWQYRQVCDELGIEETGPSWIRHVFRTIADELEKPHATARIMGHRLGGLAEVYVDAVEHWRLKEVTDHVRRRFLKRPAPTESTASDAAPQNVRSAPPR